MGYSKVARQERRKYLRLYEGTNYGSLTPMFKHGFADRVYDFIGDTPQLIVDFGCGSGLPARAFIDRGHGVLLIDFAPKPGIEDWLTLWGPGVGRFLEADICDPDMMQGIIGHAGLCLDVMEHIPASHTEAALRNIANAVPRCFFAIPMCLGGRGNRELHINIKDRDYWETQIGEFFELERVESYTLVRSGGGQTLLVNAITR